MKTSEPVKVLYVNCEPGPIRVRLWMLTPAVFVGIYSWAIVTAIIGCQ